MSGMTGRVAASWFVADVRLGPFALIGTYGREADFRYDLHQRPLSATFPKTVDFLNSQHVSDAWFSARDACRCYAAKGGSDNTKKL
jgi:hypothetical protein